jgi:hypothetical protein
MPRLHDSLLYVGSNTHNITVFINNDFTALQVFRQYRMGHLSRKTSKPMVTVCGEKYRRGGEASTHFSELETAQQQQPDGWGTGHRQTKRTFPRRR